MRRAFESCRRPRPRAVLSFLAATWMLCAPPAAAQDAEEQAQAAAQPEAEARPGPAAQPELQTSAAGVGAASTGGGGGGAGEAGGGSGGATPGSSAEGERSALETRGRALSSRSAPTKKRRGDINPCMTPDPGWGVYDPWSRAPSMGQMMMPHKGGVTKRGSFDVLIHFHGHEAVRKEFVKTANGIVLVGIDLGIGSGAYTSAFSAPYAFEQLLASIERAVAKKTGKKKATIRKLGLSAWSAGYGAIEQILRQPAGKRVDALVLLDSLHAGYADEQQRSLKRAQIEPFISFARRAAAGEAFMFMSHSSIVPPGYASTGETATFIVQQLRGKPRGASRHDVLGLDMTQRYDRGGFHLRGYTGDDKPDHCAHIGLMADIIRVHLEPRWKTPKGRR